MVEMLHTLGFYKASHIDPVFDYLSKYEKKEFIECCEKIFGRLKKVAIKFMTSKNQYNKEILLRKVSESRQLESKYVLNLLECPGKEQLQSALADLTIDCGYGNEIKMMDYKYVIIMPAADRSLDAIYRSEQPNKNQIRLMMTEIALALEHCHKKKIIHCDLKMLNVVRVDCHMKLIDFDAATKYDIKTELNSIDYYAGSKYSSGVLPPEMFYELLDGDKEKLKEYWTDVGYNDVQLEKVNPKDGICVKAYSNTLAETRIGLPYDLIRATPQLDIWSFGVMLFTLCARDPFTPVTLDGDVIDIYQAATWNENEIRMHVLKKDTLFDDVTANLLLQLLHPDPKKRISSMIEVLLHPYFQTNQNSTVTEDMLKKMN